MPGQKKSVDTGTHVRQRHVVFCCRQAEGDEEENADADEKEKQNENENDGSKNGVRVYSVIASSDVPLDLGGYYEVLVHTPEAVDVSKLKSVLFNHGRDAVIGGASIKEIADGKSWGEISIYEEAKTSTGLRFVDLIENGHLSGVSVCYSYSEKDCDYDEKTRTLTVKKWQMQEVTVTPVQADAMATVQIRDAEASGRTTNPQATSAAGNERLSTMPGQTNIEYLEERTRRERAEAKLHLVRLAASHSITFTDEDLNRFQTVEAGQDEIIRRMSERMKAPTEPITPHAEVTYDEMDRIRDLGINSLLPPECRMQRESREYVTERLKSRGMTFDPNAGHLSFREIATRCALHDGHRDARDWSNIRLSQWIAGRVDFNILGVRSHANQGSAAFTNILANTADVSLMNGFNMVPTTYRRWCNVVTAKDFKTVTVAGLSSGRLEETPENIAASELSMTDGGYTQALAMFMKTISLSFQQITNDSLGEFMRQLQRVGAIGAQTVEYEVFNALSDATWTNDTVAAALTTASNIETTRATHMEKLDPNGNAMNQPARFLIADIANAYNAELATGQIYAPGQNNYVTGASRSIEVVESTYVGDTNLNASNLATSYYLASNPAACDTLRLAFLEGLGENPIMIPYDAMAVAAEKWKIMLPFKATVATHTDSAGNSRITGITRGTAA